MSEAENNPVSMHRLTSLSFLENTDVYAVSTGLGQKDPMKGWNPAAASKERSDEILATLRNSDTNVAGHFHTKIVDVDIDSDDPTFNHALDVLLPPSSHVWGHGSRPRSHRAYELKEDTFDRALYPFLRKMQRIPECAIEIRGGPVSSGEYTLLPGSQHPDGDFYEWADLGSARSGLSIVNAGVLVGAIRIAGAVALIAPYWTEGVRNDLCMALSGFLYKAAQAEEDIGAEGEPFMTRENAERLLRVMLSVTEDDSSDKTAREKTFARTWSKAARGAKVTGATTLAKLCGDPDIVRKLYLLLTDSEDAHIIEAFCERFVIWEGQGLVIDTHAAAQGRSAAIMKKHQFQDSFGNQFFYANGKRVALVQIFFTMRGVDRVQGLTFEPGQPVLVEKGEHSYINQWSGFEIDPHPDPVTDEQVAPFLSYVREVVASNDEVTYRWVIHWIADMFQNPAEKPRTAMLLVGRPGTGKSFLGSQIIRPLIGGTHAGATIAVETLTSNFNVDMTLKIFMQCDEATNVKQKAAAAKLRGLITEDTMRVEPKGVNAYSLPNHMRFLFTSEEADRAIDLSGGEDERRYTVIAVNESMKGRLTDYWRPLVEWLHADGNYSRIRRWLDDVDLDKKMIEKPLASESKRHLQMLGMREFDAWLKAMVDRGHPLSDAAHSEWFHAPVKVDQNNPVSPYNKNIVRGEWPSHVNRTAMVEDFKRFCRENRIPNVMMSESIIGTNLSSRGLQDHKVKAKKVQVSYEDPRTNRMIQDKIRLYPMPSREDVVKYLLDKFGYDPNDPEIEEERDESAMANRGDKF